MVADDKATDWRSSLWYNSIKCHQFNNKRVCINLPTVPDSVLLINFNTCWMIGPEEKTSGSIIVSYGIWIGLIGYQRKQRTQTSQLHLAVWSWHHVVQYLVRISSLQKPWNFGRIKGFFYKVTISLVILLHPYYWILLKLFFSVYKQMSMACLIKKPYRL